MANIYFVYSAIWGRGLPLGIACSDARTDELSGAMVSGGSFSADERLIHPLLWWHCVGG